MKLITRDTDYAIRALCYSAGCPDRKVCAGEIVAELKIPRPFLRKILQLLSKKGIIRSYKGKGGGFKLAVSPAELLLADVIEIFQGPLKMNECLFKKRVCRDVGSCVLKSKIDSIERRVISELKTITISSLM